MGLSGSNTPRPGVDQPQPLRDGYSQPEKFEYAHWISLELSWALFGAHFFEGLGPGRAPWRTDQS